MSNDGWIDLQVNGRFGIAFDSPSLTLENIISLTRRLVEEKTKGYLPTIITAAFPEIALRNAKLIKLAKEIDPVCNNAILGIHLEGPFISPKPGYVGAHKAEKTLPCDISLIDELQKECDGLVKLITIAAETEGAEAFTEEATNRGIAISIGHGEEWRPNILENLANKGAVSLTHVGNGIPALLPRHDNIILSALAQERLTVMFIPDGFHLPDHVIKVFLKAMPIEKLIAVSDCAFPGGLPPGEYEMNGVKSYLEPNGFLRSAVGTLNGSSCSLSQAVDVLRRIGASESVCKALAHDNPLKLIGIGIK